MNLVIEIKLMFPALKILMLCSVFGKFEKKKLLKEENKKEGKIQIDKLFLFIISNSCMLATR